MLVSSFVVVAEVAEDEFDELDGQNPDLSSALPMDLEHVPLDFSRLPVDDTIKRSQEFYNLMNQRRTVRFFSRDPVPADVIRNIIRAAGMFHHFYSNPNIMPPSFFPSVTISKVLCDPTDLI